MRRVPTRSRAWRVGCRRCRPKPRSRTINLRLRASRPCGACCTIRTGTWLRPSPRARRPARLRQPLRRPDPGRPAADRPPRRRPAGGTDLAGVRRRSRRTTRLLPLPPRQPGAAAPMSGARPGKPPAWPRPAQTACTASRCASAAMRARAAAGGVPRLLRPVVKASGTAGFRAVRPGRFSRRAAQPAVKPCPPPGLRPKLEACYRRPA